MHADSERMDNALVDVKGVGPSTAQLLVEAGFTNVASLASARSKALETVRGIGSTRATSLRSEAQQLLAGGEPVPAVTGSEAPRRVEKAPPTKKTKKTKPAKKTRKAKKTKPTKKTKKATKKARKTTKTKPTKKTKPAKKAKPTKKAKKAKS